MVKTTNEKCPTCGKVSASYNEGHTLGSSECLRVQLLKVRSDFATLKHQVGHAINQIEADAIACEQEAKAFNEKNDKLNGYIMGVNAMAHRIDIGRLNVAMKGTK